jgi:RNA polymerase sigma factor (sigma-70 family)
MLPEELLQHIAQGDANAFRQLYELFKARVYNTCISYLQNEGDAEEAMQDVFVEIHHAAGSYKGHAGASTWIYRITVNKCLDRLRYNNRQKRFSFLTSLFHKDTGALIHDAPHFEHPGAKAENREQSVMLFKAIRQLPENQQTAFILKQIEGLSQREIAEVMGMGEKAVESLLQRAKGNLRKILADFYNPNEG